MARFSKSSLARLLTSTTSASSSSFYLRHFSESAEPQRNIWISLFSGNRLVEGRPKDSRKIQIEKTSQPRVFGKSEKTSKSTEEIDEIDHLNFLEQTWRYINETRSDINSLRWKNNMVIIYYLNFIDIFARFPCLKLCFEG
ncbi:hypothetical protein MtrunA17_Chr2g0311151 [Medicago truncatula]|uniref:Uncharacterized protein n=1 Tax=Medicago truncatula TaxID=3880 RepID=A0A396J8A2_MEDTR|nr:hypothetical protein MtrunA17_Chr2g0311151 [Medicago truncatula]